MPDTSTYTLIKQSLNDFLLKHNTPMSLGPLPNHNNPYGVHLLGLVHGIHSGPDNLLRELANCIEVHQKSLEILRSRYLPLSRSISSSSVKV